MENNEIYKTKIKLYWKTLGILVLLIIIINIILHKYINVISFTNLFLLIIPNWVVTLLFSRNEIKKIKHCLKDYIIKNYPEKIKDFYDNYHSNTNPGTKPIFALFMDKELLKDNSINTLKKESEKAYFLIVSVSAITIMFFLISTVFISRDIILSLNTNKSFQKKIP